MHTETLTLARLPIAEREEAERWARGLEGLTGPIGAGLAGLARDFGVSVQSARRKYDGWRRRGIAGLVNGARHPDFAAARSVKLDPETIEYYRRLCIENGRKCRTAYKKLCREFFAGADIPGLGASEQLALPEGWSYSNFQRHAPTGFELKAARRPRTADRSMAMM